MRSSLLTRISDPLRVLVTLLCVASASVGLWIAPKERLADSDVAGVETVGRTLTNEVRPPWRRRPFAVVAVREEGEDVSAGRGPCEARLADAVPPSTSRIPNEDAIERDGSLRALARSRIERSAESAVAWALELPDTDRSIALGEIAVQWAEVDGFHAALLAADYLDDPNELRLTVPRVVERWVRRDADAAAEWVAAFPESELRSLATAHLRWARLEIPTPPSGLPGEDFEDRSAVSEPRKTPTQNDP